MNHHGYHGSCSRKGDLKSNFDGLIRSNRGSTGFVIRNDIGILVGIGSTHIDLMLASETKIRVYEKVLYGPHISSVRELPLRATHRDGHPIFEH